MSITELLLEPARRGRPVSIVTGRALSDVQHQPDGNLAPLVEILRAELLDRGFLLVEFSRSGGLTSGAQDLKVAADRAKALAVVESLKAVARDQREPTGLEQFNALLQGLLCLGRAKEPTRLNDGRTLNLAVFAHFGEHLVPETQPAHRNEQQVRALESVLDLARKPSFRKSGHLLFLVEGRPGTIDSMLQQELTTVRIPMPDAQAKLALVAALGRRYPQAQPAEAYSHTEIANSSANTPNNSTEGLFLWSHRERKPIHPRDVWHRKQESVAMLSEGTLRSLDPEEARHIRIVGRMSMKAMALLRRIAEGLRAGDPSTLRNVLLCGPPSSGKTIMAQHAAAISGVPAYTLESSKSSLVGESERKTRVQHQLLRDQGGFGFIDELEHMLPDRSKPSLDSGTSDYIAGAFQTLLADSSLSGKVAIMTTSNRPGNLSAAMLSRWFVIPVFSASPDDLPAILGTLCEQIGLRGMSAKALNEAAQQFHRLGASPREMREALISTRNTLPAGANSDAVVLAAAVEMINGTDQRATELGDLSALAFTRSRSLLPWYDEQTGSYDRSFVLPAHIQAVLDEKTWEIDQVKLHKRLNKLSSVNI